VLKGNKLEFIPVRDDKKVSKAYDPEGFTPANFLIGSDGRVWFHPQFPIFNLARQRTLELEVESLLRLTGDYER